MHSSWWSTSNSTGSRKFQDLSLHTLYKSFKFNISYYICTLFFNIWGHVSCIDVLYRWYPATEWDSEVRGGDVTDPTEAIWAGSGAGQHATTESQVSPIQSFILKWMIYKLKPINSLVCMDIGAKVSQFSLIQLMFTDIIWSSYLKITKVWREIPATSQIVSQKFNKIHFFNEFFMMTVILVNASLILGFFAGH